MIMRNVNTGALEIYDIIDAYLMCRCAGGPP